jgi:uracil-DNA glycosylase
VSEDQREELRSITRNARQRLESLRRAGVDYVPAGVPAAAWRIKVQEEPKAEPELVATPAPVVPRPVVSAPPKPVLAPAPLFGDEIDAALVPLDERPARLAEIAGEVAACTKCPLLASTRIQTVFGVGSPTARLMFIGEAPGADEDRTGEPFVGRAGQLLTDMITKGMGLTREEVYIANILKSRPPENRNPLPDEIANCLPFLERQLAVIRPQFICMLGKVAAGTLLQTALPMNKLRGRWHQYRGIPAIATYHPSYLLRTPAAKKDAWEDLQLLMKAMGIAPPSRKKS